MRHSKPYLWKFKLLDVAGDIARRTGQRSVQATKARQEGFMVKSMVRYLICIKVEAI